MLNRLLIALLLCIILTLSACSNKPYGHYEDNKMIGNIERLELENNLVEVDISEWDKSDVKGNVNDYGVSIFVKEGDSLPSTTEDTLMGLLSKSPINLGVYQEDFVDDYMQELNIENFPVMLVFDAEGLVNKTYDVDELVAFFYDQKH